MRFEQCLEMFDQAFELFLRGRGQQVFPGRLGEVAVFRPFIGNKNHRLGKVERPEFGIDRHGYDCPRQRNICGFEPRALGTEQDRATALVGSTP